MGTAEGVSPLLKQRQVKDKIQRSKTVTDMNYSRKRKVMSRNERDGEIQSDQGMGNKCCQISFLPELYKAAKLSFLTIFLFLLSIPSYSS